MNSRDQEDLSAKLRTWKIEPHVPSNFQRQVWQRISSRQASRPGTVLANFIEWFFARLARPKHAVVLAAVSLSVALSLAHFLAQSTNAKRESLLEARYTASVDPLAMAR